MNHQMSLSPTDCEHKEITLEHAEMDADTAVAAYHEGLKKGEKHAAELWDSEGQR